MKSINKNTIQNGFTLIELIAVMAIIGIIGALVSVGIVNARQRAADASVQNDMSNLENAQRLYALKNGGANFTYPGGGQDYFKASPGNTITVAGNSTDGFCYTGYNPNGSKNSTSNAYTIETTSGACVAASGGGGGGGGGGGAPADVSAAPVMSVNKYAVQSQSYCAFSWTYPVSSGVTYKFYQDGGLHTDNIAVNGRTIQAHSLYNYQYTVRAVNSAGTLSPPSNGINCGGGAQGGA